MKNQLSIIIPVLNEADNIALLLNHLINNSSPKNSTEIIIVDGGSTDGTLEKVKAFVTSSVPTFTVGMYREGEPKPDTQTNIKLLHSPKGRAKQMNLGAKHATGNILYFLHADSFPPKNFDALIINEIEKGNQAGCFRLQFDSKHWWLRLASWLTQFSWRACRGGDQSQFITKKLFDDIGGYDENYTIYEDNILINELYARKKFVVIQEKIKTSARLYQKHGVWKLQYHFWTIYVKKWFGASADELYNYYKKHIAL
ncbi:TIGR04283 family arsenosugar biosynthesis glycosyltransferase [Hanstruepera flava]|uniref:TIGR04283 family arsenosugar biosynthesis glycosyltransferase n=1 Tax=Hanstruepera flava TaxID=2930218 RepID=UPI002028F1A8|nr:TIGR04283 family arsenosugar biosynthesis glycosyltransferase [Hanstruepera flava]